MSPHLSAVARAEWERVAETLHRMRVLTTVDRAALAASCDFPGAGEEPFDDLVAEAEIAADTHTTSRRADSRGPSAR